MQLKISVKNKIKDENFGFIFEIVFIICYQECIKNICEK